MEDPKLKFTIVLGIITIAVMIVTAMLIRAVFREDIDSAIMLQVWNPIVALLGGLVGYVAGRNNDNHDA
jgi:hypothetical protein